MNGVPILYKEFKIGEIIKPGTKIFIKPGIKIGDQLHDSVLGSPGIIDEEGDWSKFMIRASKSGEKFEVCEMWNMVETNDSICVKGVYNNFIIPITSIRGVNK